MTNEEMIAVGGTTLAGAFGLVALFSQLKSVLKRDSVDAKVSETQQDMVNSIQKSYETQLAALNERVTRLDLRLTSMDEVIHIQAIKITRLMVVVTHLRSLLNINQIPLSEFVQEEIDSLTSEPMDQPQSK